MELRPHQIEAIEGIRSYMRAGHKRIMLGANVSFGKTIVAAHMMLEAHKKGKRGVFICDRIQLVEQTIEKFEACGLWCGVVQGNHPKTDPRAPIQVASIQTLTRRRMMLEFDFAIVDECFPAGTIVKTLSGDKPIELVRSGDTVYNAVGTGVVYSIFSKPANKLAVLRLSNGKTIRCTTDHPIFTSNGWKEAGKLEVGQRLYGLQDLSSMWNSVLCEGKQGNGLADGVRIQEEENLLKILLEEVEEPDALCGIEEENGKYSVNDWPYAKDKRRKRSWRDTASKVAERAIGSWLGCGIYPEVWAEEISWGNNPMALQNRFGEQRHDVGDRDRWEQSLITGKEAEGFEKNKVSDFIRLEGIEIVECGGDEVVYNLRVSGHPSYFVEGVLVHNCHVLYSGVIDMMESYNNVPFIGLSATPYSKGLGKYFTALVVPITTRELLEKGYLCPVKYYAGEQPDLEHIKLKRTETGGKDYDPTQLAIEMEKPKLIGDVVKTWLKLGENSQTIAFCPSISHSRGLVAEFERAGVPSVHIDAYTEPELRQDIYRRHNAGEFKILSCSSLLNTGYDSPSTRCIIDCYPTKSLIRYVQRVGRIMRICEGKEYAIYLDHASNVCRHGFAEDVVPDCLDDGTKEYQEDKQAKKDEKKEPLVCECCQAIMVAGKCGVCGHEVKRKKSELEVVAGELQEIKEIDQAFYSGLLHHARQKGYADGWAKYKYREKFGVFPTGAKQDPIPDVRVAGYIKHLNIKRAKSSAKNKEQGKETLRILLEQFDG